MGLLSFLGKVGAGIAAPFTGGASLAAIPLIDGIGAAAGGASQASAQNRGAKLQALMDQDQMRLAYGQDRRADEASIMKKLFMTSMMLSPRNPQPFSFINHLGERTQMGGRPRAAWTPSTEQTSAAKMLQDQLMARISTVPQLSDYGSQMKAGWFEKLAGGIGAGATAYGAAKRPPVSTPPYNGR